MHLDEATTFFTYLDSEETTQKYLLHCYQSMNMKDAHTKSYENCHAFMYYLQHGLKFYHASKSLEILLKPLMLFYGIAHLLKATLLTRRPNYPESTKVLAHGVSSRKRKKQQYQFTEDEVKIQHQGLFPYVAKHLFHHTTMPFEKIAMKHLLGFIPELTPLFSLEEETPLVFVGKTDLKKISFSASLLDNYHLTENAFLKRMIPYIPPIKDIASSSLAIDLTLEHPLVNEHGPFFIHTDTSIYFPNNRDTFIPISEVLVHYLLLYNLSMISRYETEWWGDLLTTKPNIDYPLIHKFLDTTTHKIPSMIGKMLKQNLN